MAVRQLCVLNNPILKQRCDEVAEFKTTELAYLIEDMTDTMHRYNGCGLSASQIGVAKRVIIAEDTRSHTVWCLINPEILEMSGSENGLEGCLSYPNMRRKIKRPTYVKVRYYNVHGVEFVEEFYDFMARIVCHEIDHLNGICKVSNKRG